MYVDRDILHGDIKACLWWFWWLFTDLECSSDPFALWMPSLISRESGVFWKLASKISIVYIMFTHILVQIWEKLQTKWIDKIMFYSVFAYFSVTFVLSLQSISCWVFWVLWVYLKFVLYISSTFLSHLQSHTYFADHFSNVFNDSRYLKSVVVFFNLLCDFNLLYFK